LERILQIAATPAFVLTRKCHPLRLDAGRTSRIASHSIAKSARFLTLDIRPGGRKGRAVAALTDAMVRG
jgi:hypothetical protein